MIYIAIIIIAAIIVGLSLCRVASQSDEWIERAFDNLEIDIDDRLKTQDIIETVRCQQWAARSKNRHLIVSQEMRKKGELVWPWDRDIGQGDA